MVKGIFLLNLTAILMGGPLSSLLFSVTNENSLLEFSPTRVKANVAKGYYANSNSHKLEELRLMNNIRNSHRDLYSFFKHTPKWIYMVPNKESCAELEYHFKNKKSTFECTPHNVPDPDRKVKSQSQVQIWADGRLVRSLTLRPSKFERKLVLQVEPFTRLKLKFCKLKEFRGSGVILLNPRVY